ncbi:transporter substrate-binding domain-containing protein [Eggerthella sinensis]|uniref:Amino acid ABC transporter substrate-binding protein n=2 Tax=Eggerthella sinensis TaxID=242230 RepID=A0A3N0IWF3_9ACTN|nr:transporter substrate-binding domain-containing protein [Eggerthella sinensis]MCB7037078.1 transporter substrate-binding domain-containing protein [Eggerthella sinensis]RDB69478.1 amino acid ABC transporter substrate-binding protein [Eggerthella sinensis]RNM41318.1 amino acid ABC transporter substrate-binding protein [Eggerthella sinensis]
MGKTIGARRAMLALVALVLSCLLAGLAGCGGSDAKASSGSGTLRVGVRSDVVGFGYLNEATNKYYGLEIDIAEDMAARMGYADVEFVTVTPDTRKKMLVEGDVDCMIACYSVAASREENFDFSPTYYTDSSVVMVEDSSLITSVDDLKGLTFGTMAGTNTAPQLALKLTESGFTSGEALEQNEDHSMTQFDTFRLVQLASYQDLSKALEEGTIDAACMDGAIAHTYLSADRSILDYTIDTQEYGVATQKGSSLSTPVAEAVQSMLDDGTIAALTDKWD